MRGDDVIDGDGSLCHRGGKICYEGDMYWGMS